MEIDSSGGQTSEENLYKIINIYMIVCQI